MQQLPLPSIALHKNETTALGASAPKHPEQPNNAAIPEWRLQVIALTSRFENDNAVNW